uniref:Uncharacterized protein n=1 Tax=Timema douglasi TaxID=61478 RepID=A0A7R8VRF7_TIMDO|nr:unnamed protein product [Timema douglasi]
MTCEITSRVPLLAAKNMDLTYSQTCRKSAVLFRTLFTTRKLSSNNNGIYNEITSKEATSKKNHKKSPDHYKIFWKHCRCKSHFVFPPTFILLEYLTSPDKIHHSTKLETESSYHGTIGQYDLEGACKHPCATTSCCCVVILCPVDFPPGMILNMTVRVRVCKLCLLHQSPEGDTPDRDSNPDMLIAN